MSAKNIDWKARAKAAEALCAEKDKALSLVPRLGDLVRQRTNGEATAHEKCEHIFEVCRVALAKTPADMGKARLKPIGPSSDDYNAWLAKRPDIAARLKDAAPKFTIHAGYEIWRNGWLACEIEHGIRRADWNQPDAAIDAARKQ